MLLVQSWELNQIKLLSFWHKSSDCDRLLWFWGTKFETEAGFLGSPSLKENSICVENQKIKEDLKSNLAEHYR